MKLYHNKEWLNHKYWQEGLNYQQIAIAAGCSVSTIIRWMRNYSINGRDNKSAQLTRTRKAQYRKREWLIQKYEEENLTLRQIASLANCTAETIRAWLKKHDIPSRGYAEATKMRWDRGDFDNEEVQKKHSDALKRAWENEERRQKTSGKNSHLWRGGPSKRICKTCGEDFEITQYRAGLQGGGSFCTLECKYQWYTGERSPLWKDGASFAPYPKEFNESLKRKIRERDNYVCAICGAKGMVVHHIDGNKQNCNPDNLITLDKHCHGKVHHALEQWQSFLFSEAGNADSLAAE